MSIHPNQAGRIIFTGIYKVLHQASPRWTAIKDQPVKDLFAGLANPTSWSSFFREAVATSIQQELILNRSYCPGLEDELKSLHDGGGTWADLAEYIRTRVRNVHQEF